MSTGTGSKLPPEGGYRCGAIRCQVSSAPLFTFACRCKDCQQLTSSAFSLGMAAPQGQPALVTSIVS